MSPGLFIINIAKLALTYILSKFVGVVGVGREVSRRLQFQFIWAFNRFPIPYIFCENSKLTERQSVKIIFFNVFFLNNFCQFFKCFFKFGKYSSYIYVVSIVGTTISYNVREYVFYNVRYLT